MKRLNDIHLKPSRPRSASDTQASATDQVRASEVSERRGDAPAGSAGAPLVDISRVMYSLNRSFNPLHHDFVLDYQVVGVRDGFVLLQVALPEGMTRVFVTMLESLAGFFRFIDIKSKAEAAQVKATTVDPDEEKRRLERIESFNKEVCSLFDKFTAQGHEQKAAVRMANSALKEKNHPWANHETVRSILRASGRFRKNRGAEGR